MHPSAIDPQGLIDLKNLIVIAICLLLSPYMAKFFRLPISAMEIILGAVVAYFGFISTSENFKLLANVGFYYLMFIAGMEVNLRLLFNMPKDLLKKSFYYITLLYLISLVLVFSIEKLSYIFIIIIPVMSVGLLSVLFKEFGKDCYWLKISMLVATLAEVISIILLTIMGALLRNSSVFELGQSIFYLTLFLSLCLLVFKLLGVLFWWYPQLKIVLMPWEDKNEKDIRFCMAIFILIIAAMVVAKLEIALGAFIAGSFIATFFDHKKDLEHKLSSFGYGFLIPIFFIYIGSTFNVKILSDYTVVLNAVILLFVMMALRIVSAGVFVKSIGLKNTVLFGLSHSMPLTLLIATATLSYNVKLISENLYSALILTALLEAVVVMSLIKFISNYKKVVSEN
ncbi:cation:proton antiporter [Campylobacter sp. CCS1377]|uniref:Cation:proton antiporter n=1 Tax=Campylobacter sp. CCS1377 TaxID=3158229 RepID=A0AAU7E7X4_9BACT|nr:cation:proton antiporter [Campylobacter jejuni]